MKKRGTSGAVLLAALFCVALPWHARAQEVIDRIIARVENDVILLSDARHLARYQMLVEGKAEDEGQILERLIDQWIVATEAEAAGFPRPSQADVERAMQRMQREFASAEEYEQRRKAAGISAEEAQQVVTEQVYLSNYLDSRFRPSVRVEQADIEDFYQKAVLPRAKARGQDAPTLEAARDFIQEALVQRGIDEQSEKWLKESRARLHIEKFPGKDAQ